MAPITRGIKIETPWEWILLLAMTAIVVVLFVIAVVAPSNNVDAMQYHLPRALHWLQNGSLRHYPTARIMQDIRPYWAEATILHLRGLWGNDRPVNLVQWFSMLASIIAVTGIAKLFGCEKKNTWLAAIFTLTIPMGLLQASTAQNDYAAALWVVVLAYFVVLSRVRRLQRLEFIAFALQLRRGCSRKAPSFRSPRPCWSGFSLDA